MVRPGAWDYPDADVAVLQAHPDWAKYEGWGAVQLIEALEEVETSPSGDSLAALSVDDALLIVDNSSSLEDLERWKGEEKRKTLLNAIAKRIKQIQDGEM